MADVEQLTDLVSPGLDSTATYHDPYFYVWMGKAGSSLGELLRYDTRDGSSTVVDSSLDFDPIGMKILKPDLGSDYVYSSPVRGSDFHNTSVYNTGDILKLDPTNWPDSTVIDNTGQDINNPLATVISGKVYYWGGSGTSGATYEIDPGTDSVSYIGDMPRSFREGAAGQLSDGTVYNFGGGPNTLDAAYSDEVWEVDPTTASGTKVADLVYSGQSFAFNRGFGGAVQDAMYIFGGNTSVQSDSFSREIWKIEPTTGEVTVEADIGVEIRNTMVGFTPDDVMYSFGGKTAGGSSVKVFRVVGLANTVLLFSDSLGIRGASPSSGDQMLMHDDTLGRSEKSDQVNDPVLLFTDDVAQS